MIFLDTDVVSEVMRSRPHEPVVVWLGRNEPMLALSTVVIAEIRFGIERIPPAGRAPRLAVHLAAIRQKYAGRIHAFDEDSAMIYGTVMGEAALKGRALSVPDGMIAAIAIRHGAALATRDTQDFGFLDLRLMNPWA